MQIVRLRRGYRIHLSDTEYEALRFLADFGGSNFEGCGDDYDENLSSGALRLCHSNQFRLDPLGGLTEDRREK
jgi:hypothetical protein